VRGGRKKTHPGPLPHMYWTKRNWKVGTTGRWRFLGQGASNRRGETTRMHQKKKGGPRKGRLRAEGKKSGTHQKGSEKTRYFCVRGGKQKGGGTF